MVPIRLDTGDFGDAVARLHESLRKQGLQISPEEEKRKFFGPATRQAVQQFQQRNGLPVSGAVDEHTANLINGASAGISGQTPQPPTVAPSVVSRQLTAPPNAVPSSRMTIPAVTNPPVPSGLVFTVDGTVASNSQAGVGGLRVQIVDKNVGSDSHLADAVTDNRGYYQASFGTASLLQRNKSQPDLQARVYAGDAFLAASDVRYNATNYETLNVLLPANSAGLPSEHETLTSALAAHYNGRLSDLQESEDRQDITYLANKTGWDARAVALAALADQFSLRTGQNNIAPAFFYSLFRAGLPANEDTLYHADTGTLTAVWNKAAEQGVIPKDLTGSIPQVVRQFQTVSAQKLLTGPAIVGASSLKEMLTTSRLNNAQQTKFAELYVAYQDDMPTFWKAVGNAFGQAMANRLQVDGKLGFLTINNAPLMQKVHTTVGANGLSDPLQLAQMGYHRAEAWGQLLTEDVPIPKEIPGDTPETKRANYASYLATQVRLSYPTAAVAQMVKSGALPLTGAADGVSDQVHAFLTEHQGRFEIGMQPIEQYIARNNLQVADETVRQVKRLQRVYQITPSDDAMIGLLKRGIDAAYHVLRYDKDTFVQSFAGDLGGVDHAALTYDRSVQVHNAVLNIAISYLTAKNGIPLGTPPLMATGQRSGLNGQVLQPPPLPSPAANASDVIAYPTLEGLFGSMDFCACDHCRSILSPAAYLVDLLFFLDHDPPAGSPEGIENPQQVLLERRPDIQHLPLTCENTNTALPYIDVVNETLEYFVANAAANAAQNPPKPPLDGYLGHDSNGTASEDLLASPQFVIDSAYTTLRGERFPAPLPFHQPLENLRRYFNKFEVPLPLAMERLRKSDVLDVDRTTDPQPPPTDYGWRDILMEEIGLSRDVYEILTDSKAVPLWRMYGFPNETLDANVITGLSNAKQFARRVGITYEDLVSVLKTRFINPNSDLISKLERLGVSFATLDALHKNPQGITDADFNNLLPTGAAAIDVTEFGGNVADWENDNHNYAPIIRTWLNSNNNANYARIMGLITLAIPAGTWAASKVYAIGDCVRPTAAQSQSTLYYECTTPGTSAASEPKWPTTLGENTPPDGTAVWTCRDASSCLSFDNLAFRYSDPAKLTQNINPVEFVRLLRFIRLWKKLGWTIEQTDASICALYRTDLAPLDASDINDVTTLNTGFLTLLPRLGIIVRVMNTLNLTPKRDLLPLLACWSEIGTHGNTALYRQMFLNPALLKQDAVFADNGFGEFLHNNVEKLLAHAEALRSAFNLTGDEFDLIINALGFNTVVEVPYTHPQPSLEQSILDAGPGIGYDNQRKKLSYTGYLSATTRDALKSVAGVTADFQAAVAALYLANQATLRPLTLMDISAIFRRGWLARKLRLSVRELLLLSSLTGLDPFAAPDPTNPAILQLISLVQALKDRALKSAAALYLIWNQDLSGKSAPDPAQVAAFARTLRVGFAAVESEFAVADDPDGAIAQTRMAMVYGTDTATFFFGLLNDTLSVEVEFSDPDGTLVPGAVRQAIESKAGKTDAGVPKVAYDDFRKRLSYSGVLTDVTRDAIKLAAGVGAVAFKTAVDNLYTKNQAIINPFFARYPELQSPYNAYVSDTTHSATEKRTILLKALLPELVLRRKQQQALQSVSAVANTDLAFTQAFLNPPAAPFPIHAVSHGDQSALNDLLALETPGLSVQFFANDTATGATIPSSDIAPELDYAPAVGGSGNPLPANPTAGAAISGIWRGYLEAPESGFFNLRIEADADATVTLTLEGKSVTLDQNATLWNNTEPIELRAGALYAINLTVEKVHNVVRVQWEWQPKGQGRAVIPARYLYPGMSFEAFKEAYVRFLKAASLATGLGLTADELAYLATHVDYQINADGWLNALAVSGNPAPGTASALLKPFEALLDFARIKAEISPGDESLLAVLKDPATATQNTGSLLFTITRWNQISLKDVLARFSSDIAGLGHFDLFRRVYDAFALVQKMGISTKALIQATTNEPISDTVRDLQAALRARYEAADWRDLVQPINDEMRGLQRDALVAYILHQMRANPDTKYIDTADKLFEYFLMDVQMDPCMQTSRIRHALSSVQLFIERCLMNLEPRVAASSINAKQWEWMKRYRVWEANRKVFLWPENWLEPELRDDKSPFFKEIESELLQSDITEDSATTALLNYLAKLEEVTKLEPCGIYYVEPSSPGKSDDILHVVARTAGAHRKYYYRRYEYGSWTPWEQIKLDIEDNPVIPVVWNGRLLLFWLRILNQGQFNPPPSRLAIQARERAISRAVLQNDDAPDKAQAQEPNLANMPLSTLKASTKENATQDVQVTVQAVLCWSEYYNGKWQAVKTSDVNRPTVLGQFYPTAFNRSNLRLSTSESEEALRVSIDGESSSYFLLYNTHSLPLRKEESPPLKQPLLPFGQRRSVRTSGKQLAIDYTQRTPDMPPSLSLTPLTRPILTNELDNEVVEPQHELQNAWDGPFFFEDSRHVFYVTTTEQQVTVSNHSPYGLLPNPGSRYEGVLLPPLVLQPEPSVRPRPKLWGDGAPVGPNPGIIDPSPMQRFVTEDAYIRQGIGTTASVLYGDHQIGPSGMIPATITEM